MAGKENFFEYIETLSNWRLSDCNPFLILGNIETVDVKEEQRPKPF